MKRKTSKLIDDLYLQNNVYTYSRKNELREILSFQLKINNKLRLVKTTAALLTTILVFFSVSNVFSSNEVKHENLGENLNVLPLNIIAIITLLIFVPLIFNRSNYSSSEAFKLFYCVIFLGIVFNLMLNAYYYNLKYFLLLIVISTSTDIFAYLGGKLFGKHHFSKISPNKTVEGCLCGSLSSLIFIIIGVPFFITKDSSTYTSC